MRMLTGIMLAVVLVAGCAPSSHQALTRDYADRQQYTVNENYQSVYRRIQANARRCYETGLITAQMQVRSDLYTDIREGVISVVLSGGLGIDTYLGIEVKAIDDDHTRVTVYNALSSWNKAQPVIRRWVENTGNDC
ncbi:BPTD_2524 family lipoprotein [Kistimonas scapharcae]